MWVPIIRRRHRPLASERKFAKRQNLQARSVVDLNSALTIDDLGIPDVIKVHIQGDRIQEWNTRTGTVEDSVIMSRKMFEEGIFSSKQPTKRKPVISFIRGLKTPNGDFIYVWQCICGFLYEMNDDSDCIYCRGSNPWLESSVRDSSIRILDSPELKMR